ncbi:AMP-fatty acid ligase [Vibrio sp. HA2012]|uniref:AMP-binding protein n=1 Tax=Vibrio sp. HA2012 TaxID=1971595 RepID=UPI000C2C8A10|nr:AMP-binding protein [Vibrio sp. HA2012]PJC85794.1 AMP-fatty acid ligase [Vibrio sp. HA2012]
MSQKPYAIHSLSSLLTDSDISDDTVAFTSDGDNKTWSQFHEDVSSLVYPLKQSRQRTWALCANDSYLFAVALMALCHSGKAIVLPGNHQPAALKSLSPHFDAILYDSIIQHHPESKPGIDLEQLANLKAQPLSFSALDLSRIRITLFTSGSSGTPKAIHKTLKEFEEELNQHGEMWGRQVHGTKIYSTVSHQHVYGLLFRLLFPLVTKRPFDRYNLDYPEQVFEHAGDDAVLISSPALLKRLAMNTPAQSEQGERGTYRAIYSSGGPLSLSAAQESEALLGSLPYEVFGSTETGGIGYRQQASESAPWQLFPKVIARLDSEGCIALLAPHIDPDNWYQTTDRCTLIDDRQFMLLGRTDSVVKIEEKRVSLTEVEKKLQALDEVEEAAVILQSRENRTTLAAVIVLSATGQQEMAVSGKGAFWIRLRKQLRVWLEPVAIPKQFRFVDEIPLNSQGKRQLSELQALFNPEHELNG